MRIAIVTDAWAPQVNGVVRTLQSVTAELRTMGHELCIIAPDRYASIPCPTYPEIRLALPGPGKVGRTLAAFRPDAVHIATEGPLGLLARRWCLAQRLPFTTAYHTQFPDYVAARIRAVSPEFVWRYVRWFHAPSVAILASTPSVAATLAAHDLPQSRHWGRGVDTALFRADGPRDALVAGLPGPVQLYAGRVAVEKNIAAFLATDTPGSKVVVGDGPARANLAAEYPDVHFLGAKFGEDLAAIYRAADVFVFPSRTDTFGLVMIEALACGTPVAALPVQGPVDVLSPEVGVMDESLGKAIAQALTLDRETCATYGQGFSWLASAEQFLAALAPIDRGLKAAA
ncbi:glycosyltransferase family 4 protein [Sphingomonas pseudosanguinis]|uniref:Glycosyltransferase involved in cell wall biosynthesis n=1 Tax=Sphingomonas pseudosanguinis TaxID=413712 RepID=A0A7W6F2X9_9SPHN|nr:glycosyltransferase family 1 protein [Sphingomonas pseudosanguinis]MBB3879238.1 glycosyltransferase involved in cell wall biosynthesis [Sphingomonas pseudosanguinis]MBN3535273.1 glycosyltransferase family 1 protein [Sphingomonas pseudosanguinis]